LEFCLFLCFLSQPCKQEIIWNSVHCWSIFSTLLKHNFIHCWQLSAHSWKTSLAWGGGVVWSWYSWWVNVKNWCSWCYNKFVYFLGAVICALLHNYIHGWSTLLFIVRTLRHTLLEQLSVRFYAILYAIGTQFYTLLVHNSIYCWSSCMYISTQLCTLLEYNSIHLFSCTLIFYFYAAWANRVSKKSSWILYSVGAHFIHCWNTILYIVGAHLYLMLETHFYTLY